MNKPSTRAEPGKRNTMNRLLAAGRKIFALKGLAGARVEDIAREAKVTKQLVYHYYGSKEVLFSTVLDDASQQIMQELIALDIDDLPPEDRKSTRLNSSHVKISYAVFCLKKKK